MPAWFLVPGLQPHNLSFVSNNRESRPLFSDFLKLDFNTHSERQTYDLNVFVNFDISFKCFIFGGISNLPPDATETNENFRSHENWLQESDATDCHFMQGGHLSG